MPIEALTRMPNVALATLANMYVLYWLLEPICSYGPRPTDLRMGFSDTGRLNCEVKLTTFASATLSKTEQVSQLHGSSKAA